MKKDKYSCGYCGGQTFDDERGNCCACGAPRKKEDILNVMNTPWMCLDHSGSSMFYPIVVRHKDEYNEIMSYAAIGVVE